MRIKRQGIIIWYQHRRNIKQIKRYGHLIYASNKLKYAVLYVNQDGIDEVEKRLNKLTFVKKTMLSHKPVIRTDYENLKPDEEKDYDYNMGI